jgi:hypothetical protein
VIFGVTASRRLSGGLGRDFFLSGSCSSKGVVMRVSCMRISRILCQGENESEYANTVIG